MMPNKRPPELPSALVRARDVRPGQVVTTQPLKPLRYHMTGVVKSRRTVVNTGHTFIYFTDGRRCATTPNDLVVVLA